jgi:ABC-type Na+ efflux pump permease subunit
MDLEKEVGGFRFVADAFGIELKNVVKFFIFLIVIVFDPLAVALIIAFNGMVSNKKRKTKEILTEMMENDQKLGLYEIYGDKKEDVVENIFENESYSGKNSIKEEETPIIVENISNPEESIEQTLESDEEISDLKWEEHMHPNFPWHKRNLWINNAKAVQYWMNTKGGNYKELSKIKIEEENTKKY